MNSFCVFADILGFRTLVEDCDTLQASQELCASLHSLFGQRRRELDGYPFHAKVPQGQNYQMFSDSLVIGYPLDDFGSDGEGELGSVLSDASWHQTILAGNGLFVRGGVAFGELHISDLLCFGKAVIEAYKLERVAEWPRIVLSEQIINVVREYMNHYSDPGLTPWIQMCLVDADEKVFLNYLDVANEGDATDLELLATHRDHIVENLAKQTNQEVLAKYKWLRDYHNFFCSNFIRGTEDWWPSDDEIEDLRIDVRGDTPRIFRRLAEPLDRSQPPTKCKVFREPLIRMMLLEGTTAAREGGE